MLLRVHAFVVRLARVGGTWLGLWWYRGRRPSREAAMTEPGVGACAEKRGTSEICHVEARSLLPDCGGAIFPEIARVRRVGD